METDKPEQIKLPSEEVRPLSADEQRRERLRQNLEKARQTRMANKAARDAAKAAAPSVTEKPEGLVVKSVQVRGAALTIKDGEGHVWTVPPANEDEDYQFYRSPFAIQHFRGYNPEFDYQYETCTPNQDDVSAMITDEWYPVSRKELGVPEGVTSATQEYGMPYASAHRVGTQVLLKKPKVLVDRTREAYNRYNQQIVQQISPPPPATTEARERRGDSAMQKLQRAGSKVVEVVENKQSTVFTQPSTK